MRWMTNMHRSVLNGDELPTALLVSCKDGKLRYQTNAERKADLEEFLVGTTTGRPQATDKYSVEQLEVMDMVGIYRPDAEG